MRANDPKKNAAPEDFVSHSALRSGAAIARNWALMIALVALAEWVGWWWVTALCVLGIGTVQFALGEALVHEASHYNLFRARAWNDRLEALYALPFLTTMRAYRAEHLQHHGRLGKDDDHVVRDYTYQRLTTIPARAAWAWFGKPALGITAFEYVRWLWKMNSAQDWLKVGLFWAPVLTVCGIAGALPELLLYWFLPLFAVFAPLLHWSEVADHYRTRTGTRSRTSRIHNLLWHNNGYHAIHHRFPRIPCHNLARAHQALGGDRFDCAAGWWEVWRQISRPAEPAPEPWAGFWPRLGRRRAPEPVRNQPSRSRGDDGLHPSRPDRAPRSEPPVHSAGQSATTTARSTVAGSA
jgi:fatty acid desaturase